MTRKRGIPYAAGQVIITGMVLFLLYSYFYYARYSNGSHSADVFSSHVWSSSVLLSIMTVASGVLIELSRFWGWVVQYRFRQDLLILQGIPAGLLGLIPGIIWTKYYGTAYPFNLLADPAVSGAAGVWFGVILLRSFVERKRLPEEQEEEGEKNKGY